MSINDCRYSGGLLQVINPHGLTLYQDAKLAQFVFHTLAEKVCKPNRLAMLTF